MKNFIENKFGLEDGVGAVDSLVILALLIGLLALGQRIYSRSGMAGWYEKGGSPRYYRT